MHQRGGDAAHENTLRVPVNRIECKIDGFSDLLKFEREQRRDVYPVPRLHCQPGVRALCEGDVVALAARPVILGDFHQSERRVLVLISRLEQQNSLIRHTGSPVPGASYLTARAIAIAKS